MCAHIVVAAVVVVVAVASTIWKSESQSSESELQKLGQIRTSK